MSFSSNGVKQVYLILAPVNQRRTEPIVFNKTASSQTIFSFRITGKHCQQSENCTAFLQMQFDKENVNQPDTTGARR